MCKMLGKIELNHCLTRNFYNICRVDCLGVVICGFCAKVITQLRRSALVVDRHWWFNCQIIW